MTRKLPLLLAALFLLVPAPAAAQDAITGARIAATWCAACHVIGNQQRGSDVAPAFKDLAQTRTPGQMKGFLIRPHGAMPDIQLERQQIQDVVAYIETLK